jgi:hypothetical protein
MGGSDRRRERVVSGVVLAFALVTLLPAAAGALVWSGTSSVSSWSSTANWIGGVAPAGSVPALEFPALTSPECNVVPAAKACYTSINDVTGIVVGKLSFDAGAPYTISGDQITLANGLTASPSVHDSGFNVPLLRTPIALSGPQTWTIEGGPEGGGLSVAETVSGAGPDTLNLNIGNQFTAVVGITADVEVGAVTVNGQVLSLGAFGGVLGSLNGSDGSSVALGPAAFLFSQDGATGPLTVGELGTVQVGQPNLSGKLAVSGGITFAPTAGLDSFINQPGMIAGTNYSQLSAGGTVNINGASLRLFDGESGGCEVLTPGNLDTLVRTTGTVMGTFNGIPNGAVLPLACSGGEPPTVKINYTEKAVMATVETPGSRGKPTTTTLNGSNTNPAVGESVTYTATVTPQAPAAKVPSGSVFFVDNEELIEPCPEQRLSSSSTATCTVSYSATGSHTITAFYAGDTTFLESESAPQIVTVHAAGSSGGSTGGATGTGGTGSVLANITSSPSPAQVAALLSQEMIPSGKHAKVAAVLKSGGFSIAFKALEAGTALVNWYQLPPGAKLAKAKAKPVLVASGRLGFAAAGTATMKIKLTAAGKRLLKHARSIKLTSRGTFTPVGKAPVVATRAFVLKH